MREVWKKGDKYVGRKDANLSNKYGSVYTGRISETKLNPKGHGVCMFALTQNNVFEKYDGEWDEGVPHGDGVLYFRKEEQGKEKESDGGGMVTSWDHGVLQKVHHSNSLVTN